MVGLLIRGSSYLMNSRKPIKLLMSITALAILVIRFKWPELSIDAIAVALVFLVFLPWTLPILKSAEIPGLGKVEFREVEEAGELINQSEIGADDHVEPAKASYLSISKRDPSLALVGLRIELERRLRGLATKNGLRDDQPLNKLVADIHKAGVLSEPSIRGLESILDAGNRAAHGAEVDREVAGWAFRQGARILAILDALLLSNAYQDSEGALERAATIVEFEGPDFAGHCIFFLGLAKREGEMNLRLGYPSEKTRAGQTLVKLGALVQIGEGTTRKGSIRLTITPLGEALLSHLLSKCEIDNVGAK